MSEEKAWQQPWTTRQMREHAANWSLAGDAGMLNYLVQFSQDVIERAQGTTASLDDLMSELDHTQADLSNVCNQFNLLAHSQFVENRVAEDEVTPAAATPSCAEQDKPVHNTEAQVQEVLKNSLAFLDEMFQAVEVPAASDSEDEEDSSPASARRTHIILKPINPYAECRLPHIIGSKEFEEDDHVGLVLTPSDDDEDSESPLAELQLARAQISESSSEAEVGATFSLPSDGEDDMFLPKPSAVPQSLSFADELAAKLGGGPAPQAKVDKPAAQVAPPLEQKEPPDLFGADDDEADDWIFGPSKGTFSGGKGLFDNTPEAAAPSKSSAATLPDLDHEEDTNSPSLPKSTPGVTSTPRSGMNQQAAAVASKMGDLFDQQEAEDALFSKLAPSATRKSSALLFSDEEDLFAAPSAHKPASQSPDLFSEPQAPPGRVQERPAAMSRSAEITTQHSPRLDDTTAKKLPAGAVSMFGGKSIFPATALRRQASSSSDDSAEPPAIVAKPKEAAPSDAKPSAKPVAQPANAKAVSKQGLFDDNDSEDDLFASPAATAKTQPGSKKTQNVSLFGDSDDESVPNKPDLFTQSPRAASAVAEHTPVQATARKTGVKARGALFNDSESEDELIFSSASSGSSSKLMDNTAKPARQGLFDDDWLFNAPRPADSSSLFAESDDLFASSKPERKSAKNDLFGEASQPPGESAGRVAAREQRLQSQGSTASDDLFAPAKANKSAEREISKPAPLIQNDQAQGGSQASVQSSDLFAHEGSSRSVSAHVPGGSKGNTAKPGPVSLFDSDDDDIFAPHAKTADSKATQDHKKRLFSDESTDSPLAKQPAASCEASEQLGRPEKNVLTAVPADVLPTPQDELTGVSSEARVKEGQQEVPVASQQPDKKARAVPPQSLNVPKAASLFSEDATDDLFSASWSSHQRDSPEVGLQPPSAPVAKISPVQRGLGLNINPLALLPGQAVKPYQQSAATTQGDSSAPPALDKPQTKPRSAPQVKPRASEPLTKPQVKPRTAAPEITTTADVPEIVTSESTPVEVALDLDNPVASSTLHCPGKDRIRIPHKRKASTRRGRNSTYLSSVASSDASPGVDSAVPNMDSNPDVESTSPNLEFNVESTSPNLDSNLESTSPKLDSNEESASPKLDSNIESPSPAVQVPTHTTSANTKAPKPASTFIAPPLLDREPPPLPPSNPMSPSTDEEDVFDLPSEYMEDEDNLFRPVARSSANLFPGETFSSPDLNKDQLFTNTSELFATPTAVCDDLFSTPRSGGDVKQQAGRSLLLPGSDHNVHNISNASIVSSGPLSDSVFEPEATSDDQLFTKQPETEVAGTPDVFGTPEDKQLASPGAAPISEDHRSEHVSDEDWLDPSHARVDTSAEKTAVAPDDLFNTTVAKNDIFATTVTQDDDLFAASTTTVAPDNIFATTMATDNIFAATVAPDDDLFAASATTVAQDDALFAASKTTVAPDNIVNSTVAKDDDLFADSSSTVAPDDIFATTVSPDNIFNTSVAKDDDLFADSSSTVAPDNIFATSVAPDDIFNTTVAPDDDLFAASATTVAQDKLFTTSVAPDDDLFAASTTTVAPDNIFATTVAQDDDLFVTSTTTVAPDNIFATTVASDDDLFAASTTSVAQDKLFTTTVAPDDDLFAASTTTVAPDDDLFAASAASVDLFGAKKLPVTADLFPSPRREVAVQPSGPKSPPVGQAVDRHGTDIFDDPDDEDFFSSPTPKAPATATKVQAPKPQSSVALFSDSDDEDLFGKPTVAKSRPSVAKSQPTVAKSRPSVAKSQPTVAKSTPSAPKTTPKTKTVKKDEDFEDPLSAFQQD